MMTRCKRYKTLTFGIIFTLFIGIMINFSVNQVKNLRNREELNEIKIKNATYPILGTIYIDNIDPLNNWATIESTYAWCSGSGTSGDPYIIENVVLNGAGSGMGLYIANSEVYFMIRNSIFANASYGIKLSNTSNGMVTLNTINNNNVSGIYTTNSEHNLFTLNSVFNNSISGISLYLSNYSEIINNTIYNSNLGIEITGVNNEIIYNFVHDNTNGGIQLVESHDTTISGNFIYNNTDDGLVVNQSQRNTIKHNIVSNNTRGIILYESNLNTIYCNNITSNKFYGIYFDNLTHFNIVSWNNFIENYYDPTLPATSQGYDWDSDSGNNFHHNYWDDWNINGDYAIDGPTSTSTNQDSTPLEIPTNIYNCPPPGEQVVGTPFLSLLLIIAIVSSSILIYNKQRHKIRRQFIS